MIRRPPRSTLFPYTRSSDLVHRLFVPQRLDRIESRRAAGRIQSEPDASEGRRTQRGDNGPQRDVGRYGREAGDGEREHAAHEHPDRAPDEGQGRGLDQELPQDRAPRRAERLADADRSEEHTSELQSPCNLVCRLLLEKKKKTNTV